MAFINLGAGLAEAGKNVAATAGAWTLQAQRDDAEKEKLKAIQEFTAGENTKQRDFTKGEREAGQIFQGGEKEKDRTLQEKLSEAQRQAQIAVANISAGASMSNARLSAQVQREGQEIQRQSLTPAEVRTAEWFAKAGPEERQAFQDVLIAKMSPTKPPEGYRKTEAGNLEMIPGGPADPEVIARASGAKGKEPPSGYRVAADGKTLEFIPGGPADPSIMKRAAPMNNEQARDAGFADRMLNSQTILGKFEKEGTNFFDRLTEKAGTSGNYLQSKEYQQFRQAKEDFINAQLRRESGAAISADEFAKADRQYFPQPGDSAEVIAQKAKNRELTVEAMVRGAGPAYKANEGVGSPAAPKVETPTTIPPQDKRAIGRTYQTPTGPAIWMGNGWLRPTEPK